MTDATGQTARVATPSGARAPANDSGHGIKTRQFVVDVRLIGGVRVLPTFELRVVAQLSPLRCCECAGAWATTCPSSTIGCVCLVVGRRRRCTWGCGICTEKVAGPLHLPAVVRATDRSPPACATVRPKLGGYARRASGTRTSKTRSAQSRLCKSFPSQRPIIEADWLTRQNHQFPDVLRPCRFAFRFGNSAPTSTSATTSPRRPVRHRQTPSSAPESSKVTNHPPRLGAPTARTPAAYGRLKRLMEALSSTDRFAPPTSEGFRQAGAAFQV